MYRKMMLIILIIFISFNLFACKRNTEEVDSPNEVVKEETNGEENNLQEPEEVEEDIYYVLYLKHRNLPYIFADTFSIKESDPRLEGKSLEWFVMEELVNQAGAGDLINPIPEGTEVLSVEREDSTVIVNLSQEFIHNMKGTKEDVEATVATIVNSLITLPGNQKVKILVEGNVINNLRGVDISKSYEFIEDFYLEK